MSVFEPSNGNLFALVQHRVRRACDICGTPRWPHHDMPFLYDPDHKSFLLGRTHWLGNRYYNGFVWGGLLLVLAIVLSVFVIVVIPSLQAYIALQRDGITTSGTILERWFSKSSDGDYYYVLYEFQVGTTNTYRTDEQMVSYASYQAWATGTPVTVTYVPDDPTVSELRDDNTVATNRRRAWAMTLVCNAALLLLMIVLVMIRRRESALVNQGQVLRGEIVSFSSHEDSSNDLNLNLQYRFVTPGGKTIVKNKHEVANQLKGVYPPFPGTSVAILFLNDRTHRLL